MKNVNKWLLLAAAVSVTTGFALKAAFEPPYAAFDYEGNRDEGRKVISDKEGNIYVASICTSDTNGTDFVLIKYDSALNEQWRRHYDGLGHGADTVTGLAIDATGSRIYVSGTSYGGQEEGAGGEGSGNSFRKVV